MPGTLDHRERRILAEPGVGFGQAAPIEGAAGCVGDGGGMAAGVAEADLVHSPMFFEGALFLCALTKDFSVGPHFAGFVVRSGFSDTLQIFGGGCRQ